jgi:3-phenylpropionate/cinnamic acid dioxygenase small subunit
MDTADRTAIENLLFRYARYVDTAQYEALGELFAHASITANKTDAVLTGAAVVSEYWRTTNKRFECGTPRTHHVVTNLEYEPLSGTSQVRVRSCFTVLQAAPRLPLQPIACGRYDDVFERAAGGWRFRSKHIEVTLLGEMGEHLNIDIS